MLNEGGLRGDSNQPDAPGDDRDRCQRIQETVLQVARRLAAGASVEPAVVARDHPELMPELGEQLCDLCRLWDLTRTAPPDRAPPDPRDAVLDEELHILRRTLDKYEVVERVRYGGQGVVYRAQQRGTNRLVALKLLLDGPLASERQRHRFAREIELISRLRHPNIVTVYDSGVIRGRNFYAMEFVEGLPIDEYVVLEDLPPRDIVRLVIKVCRAVHHAHQNGIIHRDLNPANILVDQEREPRVYDFGLAKDLWVTDEGERQSLTGPGCGTLPYLSPEQAGGFDGQVDVRSDVYAIGLVLYELLTDRFPYPIQGEPAAVRQAIVEEEPLPLRKAVAKGASDRAPELNTIDCDLEMILGQALAKIKDDRYQTAAELAEDLDHWLRGEAVGARAGNRLYLVRKTLRKYRIRFGFAAALLLMFVVSSATVTRYWLQARAERDNAIQATNAAYNLFDMALTEIEESVRPLPGGVAVRDRLLERLTDQVTELEGLARSDQALNPVRNSLLEKQGDIAAQQGRRDEAARLYQSFLDTVLVLPESKPGDDTHAGSVIRVHRKLAEVSDDCAPIFERGIEFGERALQSDPATREARYELCRLRAAYTTHLNLAKLFQDALRHSDRALELADRDAPDDALDDRWRRVIAQALSGRSAALRMLGDGAEAAVTLERAMGLRQKVVDDHPADTQARYALQQAYSNLASLARNVGQLEEARAHWETAAQHAELLVQMDPDCCAWDLDHYALYHKLAALCLDLGDLESAQRYTERAAAMAERWVAREDSGEARIRLAFACILRAKVHESQEAWSAAHEDLAQAVTIGEALMERSPNDLERISLLAGTHARLVGCSQQLKRAADALAHAKRACELQERVLSAGPNSVDAIVLLIDYQIKLADAHIAAQTAADLVKAADTLADAGHRLRGLASGGKLTGWERAHQYLRDAINARQQALAQSGVLAKDTAALRPLTEEPN